MNVFYKKLSIIVNIFTRFFEVEQKNRSKGIILTDNSFLLNESKQFNNFNYEIEASWRLVKTAWSLNISPSLLQVHYDEETNLFYIDKDMKNRRIDITSSRDSLNGYQKKENTSIVSLISALNNLTII
jgi:hypothetical protein